MGTYGTNQMSVLALTFIASFFFLNLDLTYFLENVGQVDV